MQRLGVKISDHLFGRTILDREFIGIDAVGDEIEAAVEMFGSLAAGLATILFEEDSTLVVLVENSILMTIALCFEKIVGPKNDWHKVVGGNEFSLGRASGVDLLFGGRINGHAFTKRHAATRMTTHVRMRCMRAVNPPFGDGNRVSAQDQRELNGSAQITDHAS